MVASSHFSASSSLQVWPLLREHPNSRSVPVARGRTERDARIVLCRAVHPRAQCILLSWGQLIEPLLHTGAQFILRRAVLLVGFDDNF
jgi:hypothetical protein